MAKNNEKKILVGIEKREKIENGQVVKRHTILYMLVEAGTAEGNIVGQKTCKAELWNVGDVENELTVIGPYEIGNYITVLYEGEGDYKKASHVICEKRK